MTNKEWLKENGYYKLYKIIMTPILKCIPRMAGSDYAHNLATQIKLMLDEEFEEKQNDN